MWRKGAGFSTTRIPGGTQYLPHLPPVPNHDTSVMRRALVTAPMRLHQWLKTLATTQRLLRQHHEGRVQPDRNDELGRACIGRPRHTTPRVFPDLAYTSISALNDSLTVEM